MERGRTTAVDTPSGLEHGDIFCLAAWRRQADDLWFELLQDLLVDWVIRHVVGEQLHDMLLHAFPQLLPEPGSFTLPVIECENLAHVGRGGFEQMGYRLLDGFRSVASASNGMAGLVQE